MPQEPQPATLGQVREWTSRQKETLERLRHWQTAFAIGRDCNPVTAAVSNDNGEGSANGFCQQIAE